MDNYPNYANQAVDPSQYGLSGGLAQSKLADVPQTPEQRILAQLGQQEQTLWALADMLKSRADTLFGSIPEAEPNYSNSKDPVNYGGAMGDIFIKLSTLSQAISAVNSAARRLTHP